jgi:hypothetical protein
LWRAADEHGAELDVLLQKRCDKAAAKCFLKRVVRSNPVPRKIITDQLRNYSAAKAEIPELRGVKHVFVNAAAQLRCAETRGRPPHRSADCKSVCDNHRRSRLREPPARHRLLPPPDNSITRDCGNEGSFLSL